MRTSTRIGLGDRVQVGKRTGTLEGFFESEPFEDYCVIKWDDGWPGAELIADVKRLMPNGFVEEWADGIEFVAHLDGVPWHDAPKPFRWHRHKAQTKGFMGGEMVHRCACGATRYNPYHEWIPEKKPRVRF